MCFLHVVVVVVVVAAAAVVVVVIAMIRLIETIIDMAFNQRRSKGLLTNGTRVSVFHV